MAVFAFTSTPRESVSPGWAPPPGVRARTPVVAPRATLLSKVRAALRRRRTRLILAEMSDHMLKDIGLTRCDADYEANKPFWRL
jgi:uncharacterized protein YjiS (DUF1127 family)